MTTTATMVAIRTTTLAPTAAMGTVATMIAKAIMANTAEPPIGVSATNTIREATHLYPSRVRWRGPERPRPIFPPIARRDAGNRLGSATAADPIGPLGSATAADPIGPLGDLGFPDRHDALHLVHDPRTGREGFRAMDRGAGDRDGIPADRDAAEPVDDGQVRETELVLGPLPERGEALDRHRTVHLVIEGFHPFVRADRPEEQDDGTRVIPPHAVDHGLEIDARPPNLDHPAPPLTGGRSATSSPSWRIRSDAARS